jgi:hypothetical protein
VVKKTGTRIVGGTPTTVSEKRNRSGLGKDESGTKEKDERRKKGDWKERKG